MEQCTRKHQIIIDRKSENEPFAWRENIARQKLGCCNQAGLQEVEEFIERESLCGLGWGLIDLQLLASVLITPGAKLWTLDKWLEKLAERFGVAYRSSPTA